MKIEVTEQIEKMYALGQKSGRSAYSTQVVKMMRENRHNPEVVALLLQLLSVADRDTFLEVRGIVDAATK